MRPVAELDDGLEPERDLVLERPGQMRDRRQLCCVQRRWSLAEHHDVRAGPLGLVHGDVGVAQQVSRGGSSPTDGDADRCREADLDTFDRARCAQHGQHVAGDTLRGGTRVRRVDQQPEFVAAEATHLDLVVLERAEVRADTSQQLVTRGMAERVVDPLEVVEVDDGHGVTGRIGPQPRTQPVEEDVAGPESGERIVLGAVTQLLLGSFEGGDVDRDAGENVAPVHVGSTGEDAKPSRLTVGMEVARGRCGVVAVREAGDDPVVALVEVWCEWLGGELRRRPSEDRFDLTPQ